MSNYEKEAAAHLEEAATCASYTSWFGGNKLENAQESYGKAANSWKLAKKWKESGDAYIAQANILKKMKEVDEASTAYMNAAKAFKKTDPKDSIHALQKAVEILVERGRFQSAASNQKQIAELYETDLVDIEKAMHAFELAADWYQAEDSNAQANSCWLKVATFAAQLDQFEKAIEKFEHVASASMDNNLLKWSLRGYYLQSGLCVLCTGDLVRVQSSINRYLSNDVTFADSREYKFLQKLLDACEANDKEVFTEVIIDYDKLTKLDAWKTSILLKIKNGLSEGETDFT